MEIYVEASKFLYIKQKSLLDRKKLTKAVFKAPKWTKSFFYGGALCALYGGVRGALYAPYLSDFGRPMRPIWDPW